MSRRFQPVTVSGTSGAALATGDSVTGSNIDNVVVQNGLVRVTLEVAAIAAQRGACHLYRWNGTEYQRAITANYGDYTYFTNTPAARPDRVRIVEAGPERVELALEWDSYSLVDASTYPNGIASRDYSGNLNYAQGAVNPNWKYITTTHLVKSVIVLRGREGYFTGYHSDPLIGPVGSRIPTDNNDSASWGEREMGLGEDSQVSFSSAGAAFDVHHPVASGTHSGLGIDDPSGYGGAEQTTGPWWVASLPRAASVAGGLCRYIVLRQRLMVLAYQFGVGQYGLIIINGVNEARDSRNVPYESMIFIGAFPYEVSDFTAEPTTALRQRLAARAPSDFDESGNTDDNGVDTMTASSVRDELTTGVISLTADSLAHVKFRAHDNRQDFRTWCNANPQAAFRRFQIRDVGTVAGSEVYDAQQTWHVTEMECVVAYPRDYRYGRDALIDLDEVLWEDLDDIDNAIGSNGAAAVTTATVTTLEKTTEEGAACVFAVLRLQTEFWRATA